MLFLRFINELTYLYLSGCFIPCFFCEETQHLVKYMRTQPNQYWSFSRHCQRTARLYIPEIIFMISAKWIFSGSPESCGFGDTCVPYFEHNWHGKMYRVMYILNFTMIPLLLLLSKYLKLIVQSLLFSQRQFHIWWFLKFVMHRTHCLPWYDFVLA